MLSKLHFCVMAGWEGKGGKWERKIVGRKWQLCREQNSEEEKMKKTLKEKQ